MSSSTYLADGNIRQGDVVCLVTSKNLEPHVRTASVPLPVSAPIVGVALTDASNGPVTVADCGGVDASVTGLTSGIRQPIAVSSSGRCTRTLAGAVWLIGDANESGDLEIRPRIFDSLDVRLFGAVGDGKKDDSAPIQAAIAAYGGSSGRIVFTNGLFRISQAFSLSSIPVSVATEFGPGGQLKVDDGVRVVFDGSVIAPPLQQIFQNATLPGHGTVDLRGNQESYVEWWGARGLNLGVDDAPAFQAAINASRHHLGWNQTTRWGGTAVRFFNGPYRWRTPVHLSGSVTLEGEKPGEFSPSLIVVDPDVGAIGNAFKKGNQKESGHKNAPVVDLSGVGASSDVTTAFTEQMPVVIAPAGTLSDADSATLSALTVTLTARPDGNAVESLSLNEAAVVTAARAGLTVNYTASTGVLSIEGAAMTAQYQTILQGILYNNTSNAPTTTHRWITVVVVADDGKTPSATQTVTLTDGGALVVDGYAYDKDAPVPGHVARAAWARIRNMSMKQINDPNSLVITCGVKVYANRVQIENFYAFGFGDGITITSTKTYEIPTANGSNTTVNAIADVCELSGTIDIGSCGRYGLWIHGGDANVTNITGSLSVHDCGSWGLVLDSFLGDGALGSIHTASNGVMQLFVPERPATPTAPSQPRRMTWMHGEGDYGQHMWAPGRAAVRGQLVLPSLRLDPPQGSPEQGSGWQYRVTTVSTTNPTFASPEPSWATATREGATLTDAHGNVFTAWMEEGGSAVRHYAAAINGMVVIGFLYQELDQQSARLPNSVILGQTKDTEIDPRYAPRWGFSGFQLMPFVYQTSWRVPWGPTSNNPYDVGHPIQVEMGGNYASPFVVRRFDASQLTPDHPNHQWKHENPNWFISEEWYPDWMRWVIRSGVHMDHVGYTICGSRSLPYPGAICFPHLFIGGNITAGPTGYEVRHSAVSPLTPFSSLPDIGGTGGTANRGAWTPGDWIWNTTRNPAQQSLYPVAWRPVKKTGFPTTGWQGGANLPAGSIVRPGTPGDSIFRKRDGEKTGQNQPSWTDTPGSYQDGASTWDWWGKYGDVTAWEPVITESPTMLVKDVRRPWTVTLTEDEAAHQRIQFSGQLPDDITIIVPPGPAKGWVRLFFNNTSGPYSLTVQGSGTDPGISVPQGRSQMLWHDGTTVRAAAPPV